MYICIYTSYIFVNILKCVVINFSGYVPGLNIPNEKEAGLKFTDILNLSLDEITHLSLAEICETM